MAFKIIIQILKSVGNVMSCPIDGVGRLVDRWGSTKLDCIFRSNCTDFIG